MNMKRNEETNVRTYLLFACFGRCLVEQLKDDPAESWNDNMDN